MMSGTIVARGPMIFHLTLERAEDGWGVAECPAQPGCVSQGKDDKEALENIKEALTAWSWAEDQKAAAQLKGQKGQQEIVVAVWPDGQTGQHLRSGSGQSPRKSWLAVDGPGRKPWPSLASA